MRLSTVVNGAAACSNRAAILGISSFLLWGGPVALAQAPVSDPSAQHAMADVPADQNKQLTDQITDLRAQVAKLQAAVQQAGHSKKVGPKSGMKMAPPADKGMGDKSEMGMPPAKAAMTPGAPAMGMKDDGGEMGGMPPPTGKAAMAPGAGMGDDMDEMGGPPMGGKGSGSSSPDPAMGMCCMGKKAHGGKSGMSGMPPPAPGPATMADPAAAMTGQVKGLNLYHIGSNGFFLNHPGALP